MKRLIFMVLMMTCSATWAEWIIFSDNSKGEKFFFENNSLRKQGSIVKMWSMSSGRESTLGEKVYRSSKSLYAYDCKNEMRDLLAGAAFSGEMGTGEVIFSDTFPENNWVPIMPGSIGESEWKIACGKR